MHGLVDVDSRGVADAQVSPLLALSVCAMTRGGSARLAAVLDLLRPIAEQVVVALDERAETDASELAAVADEIVLFPHREPGDSLIPWLHAQCTGGWIFNIDDDEVPSSSLLLRLPELLGSEVTHWWLPRRWLVGSIDTFLDQPPWVPDYQLRLYRNDAASLRFSDEFHRPVVVSGQAGFAREPLWHLDCVLNSYERRREKALHYERARRGMRVAGLAHNGGFYLPELLPSATTGRVPEADVDLIDGVLAPSLANRAKRRCPIRRAARDEIDALWPGAPDEALYRVSLTPVGTLTQLPAGACHTVTVAVQNRSTRTWRYGPDAAPAILVGTRWLADDGTLLEEGVHTPLPADLPPGCSLDVPVHVRAPAQPGSYRLLVDLVHEHVRWFDSPLEWAFDVTPACRVALVGRGESLERALDELQLDPRAEPVMLGEEWYLLGGIDDGVGPVQLARLAARTTRFVNRARRLRAGRPSAPLPRGGEDCLRGLAACDRLRIAGPDWEPDAPLTRQLWRLAALTAAARRLGLAVDVVPGALAATDARDRVLARLVR